DDRLLRLGLLEQQVMKIVQGEVVEREAAAPGLGERRLQQHRHGQDHRQRTDEQRVAEHRPAPRPEADDAALAALAGHRRVAAPPWRAPAAQRRGPMLPRGSQNTSPVMTSSGGGKAAASSPRTGYSKNCQSWVDPTWKRAGSAISAGAPNRAIASRKLMMRPP